MKKMIPYSTQQINAADVAAVAKSMRSGWLTQGPAIERFEAALAKAAGTRYAVAVNSGTAALHAAYFAVGIGPGDEVIIPPVTFAATGNAALYLGAKPVFADVDDTTANMSPALTEAVISDRTKAIVPVDYAGRPADLAAFRRIADTHNIVFICDGAQSLGATYQGKPAGSIADMTIYSFHPVKTITTGEGGAVVTNSIEYANRMRMFRTHGITKNPVEMEKKNVGGWYMEMHELGFNYRMPDMNAALGESQMKRHKTFIKKRRLAANRYHALLQGIPEIILPVMDTKENQSAWHLYTMRIRDEKKHRAVFDSLRAAGIGVQVHHIPVHTHPYYKKLGYKPGSCPVGESWYAREISLPLFVDITVREQRSVVNALKLALVSA